MKRPYTKTSSQIQKGDTLPEVTLDQGFPPKKIPLKEISEVVLKTKSTKRSKLTFPYISHVKQYEAVLNH